MELILRLLWLLCPFLVFGQEAFISHYEYGEMLYQNPRGVSCAQCHGLSGEGMTIVKYKDREGNQKELKGSDIRHDSLATMIQAVNTYHEVMPRYYLTNEEMEAIYDYLQIKNSQSVFIEEDMGNIEVEESNKSYEIIEK